jgi:hypothetical protein
VRYKISFQNCANVAHEFEIFDNADVALNPSNLMFASEFTARAIHRIAGHLSSITSPINFQIAAKSIYKYFAPELGVIQKQHALDNGTDEPPKRRNSTPVDVSAFADDIAAITLYRVFEYSAVEQNLDMLVEWLTLNNTEKNFLRLAYCVARDIGRGAPGKSHEENGVGCLFNVLSNITFEDNAQKYRAIAAILDEPVEAVELLFTPPCRLLALRFMSADYWHIADSVFLSIGVTDEFIELLETPHRSIEAMRECWLQPEFDAKLYYDKEAAFEALKQDLEKQAIWSCYAQSILDVALTTKQINLVVQWFTGSELKAASLAPLANLLKFEAIREAIKRAALECCEAVQPVTEIALLRALYAATALPQSPVE